MSDPLNLIGRTISEKYEIEALVGEGGFAVVYRATHNVWKRPVAIKIFRVLSTLTTAARVNAIDNFVQEGAVLAELSERSAAICQARDIGTLEVNGQTMPYMVLEWLDGMSLDVV
ncbi:MAG: protein kinase, partial [Myxococcales bacterium]|nr:protein kinase [Myxococcales bacterium]